MGGWIDCQGTLDLSGQRWRIGKALKGERVRIEQVEERFLVYYCTTLIREIDLSTQRSTMVERWVEKDKNAKNV